MNNKSTDLSEYEYLIVQAIEKLQAQLSQLQDKLDLCQKRHKGACPTCEPVGELNVKLQAQLSDANKVIEFYGDTKDHTERGYHGVWCGHADDYSDAMQRLIDDDGKRARAYLEKYKGGDNE